ncbi:MAG: tRNA(Ile)(2)-agmatinylcytidine synthase [Candidatus Bathyarchaeota archaeon]|nr:tRNA(Ile)(2)-agmatinylcytidine synthase [Candidatus Bathyarchaeota archaeon]
MLLHIGIDDTDSPEGGCTTYVAALLVERLEALGCRFVDYPNLLRLNPNAPWKTRGNGSICLRVDAPEGVEAEIKRIVIEQVEADAEFQCDNTNPGIVFHAGDVPEALKAFHDDVVQTIVHLEEAERLIAEHCASAVAWKNRRGLIGALAAIGGTLEGDHTYELLTYRLPQNRGKKRLVDPDSVRRVEEALPETFNSIDPETGQVLIAPRGPDPVLYGVRGETPESVLAAMKMIEVGEPIERWCIFRTNQGTDAHLVRAYVVSDLKPRYPSIVTGFVEGKRRVIEGGHVIFTIGDSSGHLDCAAYEPSGGFREVVSRLREGDEVRVAGGVRETEMGLTLNLERLEVLSLAVEQRLVNPRCPACGGPTESMGRDQGLRCKRCGHREAGLTKVPEEVPRDLKLGTYLPPPRAERHLTKPFKRYGKEKSGTPSALATPWHSD